MTTTANGRGCNSIREARITNGGSDIRSAPHYNLAQEKRVASTATRRYYHRQRNDVVVMAAEIKTLTPHNVLPNRQETSLLVSTDCLLSVLQNSFSLRFVCCFLRCKLCSFMHQHRINVQYLKTKCIAIFLFL